MVTRLLPSQGNCRVYFEQYTLTLTVYASLKNKGRKVREIWVCLEGPHKLVWAQRQLPSVTGGRYATTWVMP
jgi:hypothetical protein